MKRPVIFIFFAAFLVAGSCATGKTKERAGLTEAEKERMRGYWELFVKRDPRWEDARSEWLMLSEAAQNTLVENMIRYMSDRFNGNNVPEARRAAAEIVLLDRLALEYLVYIVGDDRNSRGVRSLAISCLVNIGTAAVPGLIESLDSPRYQARRLAARGLGHIRDARAIDPLVNLLADDDNFAVREEAALALGGFREDRAVQALGRAVRGDKEPRVVVAAAAGLGRTKTVENVNLLVDRLVVAETRGTSIAVTRAIRKALHRITGLPADSSHQDFRAFKAEK